MSKILSGFSRTLPQLQAREIEKDLHSQENQLRFEGDLDSIRAELQRQLRAILESDTVLRFSQITLDEDTYRDSETLTWMVNKIATDLSALFTETDQLAKIQDFNTRFFREEVIKKVEQAADILDNELTRLELLSGRFNGLTDGVAENFRVDGQRLDRSERFAHLALVDPKTNNPLALEQEMPINLALGGLTLPSSVNSVARPSRIKDLQSSDTLDTDDAFSLLNGASPSTDGVVRQIGQLQNVIDGQDQTSWTKIIKTKIQSGGAKLNLLLDLTPGPTLANYIQIVPGFNSSHSLISVSYLSEDNLPVELELPDGGIVFTGKVILPFALKKVKKVSIVLAQPEYHYALGEPTTAVEYKFSIAEIQVGLTEFKQLGYYVTKTLVLPLISKLYLSATVNGTVLALSEEEITLPTIEYWVAYREIDEANNVLLNTYIPLLPVEEASSYERLLLNDRDQAKLMFKVKEDILNADDLTLQVWRNETPLIRPIDYEIDLADDRLPNQSRLNIQNGFNVQSEYFVRYNPLHLDLENRPVPFIDRTGLIEYLPDNSIKISRQENSRATRSEANLIVLMRGVEDRKRTLAVDRLILGVG